MVAPYATNSGGSKIYEPDDNAFLQGLNDQLLTDTKSASQICDVNLQTTDGQQIPASRTLLAARSQYFKTLFFSSFKEAYERNVVLSVSSSVLHHVLLYTYTGRCPFVAELLERNRVEQFCDDDFKLLIVIREAADCFNMNQLFDWCDQTLVAVANDFMQFACSIFECMSGCGGNDYSRGQILHLIQENVIDAFNIPHRKQKAIGRGQYDDNAIISNILRLAPKTLDQLLDDLSKFGSHEDLFECIYFWVTNGRLLTEPRYTLRPRKSCPVRDTVSKSCEDTAGHGGKGTEDENTDSYGESSKSRDNGHQENCLYVDKDRLEWSKKFTARLDLRSMRIRFVHDYVIPTGLIEKIDLADVLWNYVLSTTQSVQLNSSSKNHTVSGHRRSRRVDYW